MKSLIALRNGNGFRYWFFDGFLSLLQKVNLSYCLYFHPFSEKLSYIFSHDNFSSSVETETNCLKKEILDPNSSQLATRSRNSSKELALLASSLNFEGAMLVGFPDFSCWP